MKYLVTGGAGFIGTNTSDRLAGEGHQVVVFDNFSRPGSELNLEWLVDRHSSVVGVRGDVRERLDLKRVLAEHGPFDAVIHLAAQVAVTTSVLEPWYDFQVNALGTLNLLEAVRGSGTKPVVLFASTNKVYGELSDFQVVESETRYQYEGDVSGIPETAPLDFYSPYGCSKGAADQYMLDYHRIYDLPTIVFRNSCIYGPRQFGIEDQGWLAWFVIAAVSGRPISIFGDGKQVRDVLYIDDLVDAMQAAIERSSVTAGRAYNIGGGPDMSISIWREFGPLLEELVGGEIEITRHDWRPGDQKVYISDTSRARQDFDWSPTVGVEEGVEKLHQWVVANRELIP